MLLNKGSVLPQRNPAAPPTWHQPVLEGTSIAENHFAYHLKYWQHFPPMYLKHIFPKECSVTEILKKLGRIGNNHF